MNTKVGVLTGGGDCPGLNPAIRAVVRLASKYGYDVIGFRYGWKGALTNQTTTLSVENIDDLLARGGTTLGSSRTNPYKEKNGPTTIKKNLESNGLDALIAIGGEDTIGVAAKLFKEGLPLVGIPKTIDNDLDCTAFTVGFPTAVEIVTEALDRIRTTAESHGRVMVVEIMGRHAGWLATYGGLAGGADIILVPEFPTKLDTLFSTVKKAKERKNYAIVGVAEGAKLVDEEGKEITSQSAQPVDAFGHVQLGGIGDLVKNYIKEKTGFDTRLTSLGHLQRGGPPSAFDRVLATIYGMAAMELVKAKDYGKMPALMDGKIQTVKLSEATGKLKTLSSELYELSKNLFG